MKRLLIAFVFLFIPGIAWAQCNGIFPANTLCGNLSASPAPPAAFATSGTVIGPASSTSGAIVTWGNFGGSLLTSGAVVAPNVIAVGPKSGTNSIATFRVLITSDATIAAGSSGSIQAASTTSILADSGWFVSPPSSGATVTGSVLLNVGVGCAGCSGSDMVILEAGNAGAYVPGGHGLYIGNFTSISGFGNPQNGAGSIAFATQGGIVNALHCHMLANAGDCEGEGDIVIGHSATTSQTTRSIVIGNATFATGAQAIAIGSAASAQGAGGIAIGAATSLSSTDAIAIGQNATASNVNGGACFWCVALGFNAGLDFTGNGQAEIGGPNVTNVFLGVLAPQAAGHMGGLALGGPTLTTTNYTIATSDHTLTFSCSSTCTLGGAPSANANRIFILKTISNQAVNSTASNVVPLAGGATSNSILQPSAGKWAIIQSDGTNWNIMAGN